MFHGAEQVSVNFHRYGLMEQAHLNDQPRLCATFEDLTLKSFHGPASHLNDRSRLKARLRIERQTRCHQSKNARQIVLELVLSGNRDATRDAIRFERCDAFLRTTIKEHVA